MLLGYSFLLKYTLALLYSSTFSVVALGRTGIPRISDRYSTGLETCRIHAGFPSNTRWSKRKYGESVKQVLKKCFCGNM